MWDDYKDDYDYDRDNDHLPDTSRSWWNKQGVKVEYADMDNGYLTNVRNMFNKKNKPLPIMLMVELRLRNIRYE